MKKSVLQALTILLLSPLLTTSLSAGIIYDNGGPNQLTSNEMTSSIQTQSFTLSSARIMNGVRFWAVDWSAERDGYTGEITYFIYADSTLSPGTPGDLLASETLAIVPKDIKLIKLYSGGTVGDEYFFEFTIPDFHVESDTTYHLGFHNGQESIITYKNFSWETADDNETPTGQRWNLYRLEWTDNERENAFQILGYPVPRLTDAILALQILSRMDVSAQLYGGIDVNDDQIIGLPEVIFILQKLVEVR